MPQRTQQKLVNSFNAGLVTEFSELKFPDNASVDELNCELNRDGSRQRRKALTQETDGVWSDYTVNANHIVSTGTWYNAGAVEGYNLAILQAGSKLYFYTAESAPVSGNKLSFEFDLSPYQASSTPIYREPCFFSSIGGSLVIANPNMDTVVLSLDSGTSTLSGQKISFYTRDYDYMSDQSGLTVMEPSAGISTRRQYDTANAGWTETNGSAALAAYISSTSNYPALTHSWYSGKDASGNFSVTEWDKVYSGNSLLGNGHFVLDFFNKDRSTTSGFSGLDPEVETNRFRTVANYAGRIWYAGLGHGKNAGKILFSRIVTSLSSNNVTAATLGNCYQMNDPTAEDISDMLETDGGVISIPDATNIQKIYAADQFLYVFAENGVWVVAGVRNGNSNTSAFVSSSFSISDFFVSKISSFGLNGAGSFIEADGTPFWWSKSGIHTISIDQATGMPLEQNISLETIQTFWNGISTSSKSTVRSVYDPKNKKIYWLYKGPNDTALNQYSKILILNIPLKAFYPWSVSLATNMALSNLYYVDAYSTSVTYEPIVTSGSVAITTDSGEAVTSATYFSSNAVDANIICFVVNKSTNKVSVYGFSGISFLDFGTEAYTSYAEASYNFMGDLERRKTAPYVTVFCRSTEEGFEVDGDGYRTIHPSGLNLQAFWDFKESSSTSQSCYRIKPLGAVDSGDLTNNQQDRSVVTTRLKVRGRGRSVRLKFTSEAGKDFILLGYNVIEGINNGF